MLSSFDIHCRRISGAVRLRIGLPTARIPPHSNASPETPLPATGTPGPARAAADREVVESEREDGADGPDQVAEEDVEAVVPEVGEPRRGNVDAGEPGDGCEHEEVDGRGGSLAADGDQGVVVAGVSGVVISCSAWVGLAHGAGVVAEVPFDTRWECRKACGVGAVCCGR